MKYTDPEELKYLYSKPQQNYFAPGELRNIENFKEANEDNYMGWCIHHRLEINPDGTPGKTVKMLLAENLYYMRPASELIFLRVSEHLKLHHTHTADAIGQASTPLRVAPLTPVTHKLVKSVQANVRHTARVGF